MTLENPRVAGIDRRTFLRHSGTAAGLLAAPALLRGAPAFAQGVAVPGQVPLTPGVPDGLKTVATMEALKGKRPLIRMSVRPITPNDAFFVRYHLGDIPEVNGATWKLKVGGDGLATPAEYSLNDLRTGFEQVEVVAVCQCSGNRRGLSNPHVQGIEWGFGAMGNARWKGVRLRDVLNKAGVKKEAVEIVFDGADKAILDKTPDFVKSIPTWKALDENVLIALEMNGQPLPHWNGFPARIVVPGWTGTYWIKHLVSIEAATKPASGFWMAGAYRIPLGLFPMVDRFVSQETAVNTPITEMVVNSLIVTPQQGQNFRAGEPNLVRGIAWDGGYGIRTVEVSTDGGESWRPATLGNDLGKFSFRDWSYRFTPTAGKYTLMARATNVRGATQTYEAIFNPPGYHHNVVHKVEVGSVAGRQEE
jgi:DMSO/TMAO reductase YedYZ molybdopterin-dependent catalytic subunit